jgi:prefoldin subunit 5
MQAEVTAKQKAVAQLQAEHSELRSRQQALESTMTNQDTILAELLNLQLSPAGDNSRLQLPTQRLMQNAGQYLKRYQVYVQAAAAALAGDNQAAQVGSSAFPTYPFTLFETLALWKFSHLNLSTGEHAVVPPGYWAGIAKHMGVRPAQLQRLEAAWRLYKDTVAKLNAEREQLTQRLQEVAAAEEGIDVEGVYNKVLDAIETNLMRGRAVILLFGRSLPYVLDADQVCRACVASWPYMPIARAIIPHLLGKDDEAIC